LKILVILEDILCTATAAGMTAMLIKLATYKLNKIKIKIKINGKTLTTARTC
jgi:hypothetical protein